MSQLAAPPDDRTDGGDRRAGRWSMSEDRVLRVPFQKALTVLLTRDEGPKQADADLAAIADGKTVVFRHGTLEMYFHQLRLRTSEKPELLDQIAVFYIDTANVMHPIGLRFEDEDRWPPGFCMEGWEIANAIKSLRWDARKQESTGAELPGLEAAREAAGAAIAADDEGDAI